MTGAVTNNPIAVNGQHKRRVNPRIWLIFCDSLTPFNNQNVGLLFGACAAAPKKATTIFILCCSAVSALMVLK
jgi:hypothetical protein